MARGPWAMRSGSITSVRRTCAAPPHSPAWAVTWSPISRARSIASWWIVGSGKRCSGPARSTRDEAVGDPVRLEVADEGEVGLGLVRAHQRRDQPGVDAGGLRREPGAVRRGIHDLPAGEPLGGVEQGRPADLDVADVVARLVLDEVSRDALDGLGVLHQGDREVEGLEQLGLVGRLVGPDEHAPHAGERRGGVDPAGAGDVERRVDPERAVEVEVELGLGHRARDRAHRSLVEVGHAAMVAIDAGPGRCSTS